MLSAWRSRQRPLAAIANALCVDCNMLLGETLQGVQRNIKQQELVRITSEMDTKKIGLCIKLCQQVADFESQRNGSANDDPGQE